MIAWLAFAPAYQAPRGAQKARLGAHAFRDDAPRSLCGYVARKRAGWTAGSTARRCVWCSRVERGQSADLGHDVLGFGGAA